jgi:hypothetical protein
MTDEDGRPVSKPITGEEMAALLEKKKLILGTTTFVGSDKGSFN